MSSANYHKHIVHMFMSWHLHEEVVTGCWPSTLEECFGIERRYKYPLSQEDAGGWPIIFLTYTLPAGAGATTCGHSRASFLKGQNI